MKNRFNRAPTEDEKAEFRVRTPKLIRCADRMCGADDCPNCHPENFPTNPPTCEHNEAWGKKCGKPATHEVRIEGYEDVPSSACEFHAALAEHDGFDVRKREEL